MADYLHKAILAEEREETIHKAIDILGEYEFDTIAVRGVSGLLLGPILAHLMNKKLAVVRKAKDGSHSSSRVEGEIGERYIIVDDFVESGETVRHIREEIRAYTRYSDQPPEFVGFYGYEDDRYIEFRDYQSEKFERLGIRCINLEQQQCPAPSNA